MRLKDCYNFADFRKLAEKKLPSPIFHYIDGAADDEITYKRNTDAYEQCDLIPNVLSGVDKVDMSTTVMGQKLDMPLYCAPTALQDYFITRERLVLLKRLKNLELCLEFRL